MRTNSNRRRVSTRPLYPDYGLTSVVATSEGYAVLGTVGIETKRYGIYATAAEAHRESARINTLTHIKRGF